MKEIRMCKFCNQPFEATNGRQLFCNRKHYDTCVVCGKSFEVPASRLREKDRSRCCSRKCSSYLRKQTNLSRYVGVAPACSETVRKKMETTTEERYGVKHAAQSSEILAKMRETTQRNHGVDYYTQTDMIRKQTRETSLQKYGTQWPTASEVVKDKSKQTSLSRYGTEFPMQSNLIKSKFIEGHMSDSSKLDLFLQYKENPRSFIDSLNLDHKPTIYELSRILGVNESTVGVYLMEHNCKDSVSYQISKMEQEVSNFIKSIDNTIVIEMNTHNIIPPNELDIYLPEYKIGIECNPTATHNSTINIFDKGPSSIYPRYHLMKTQKCEEAGIFLFHIFGSEWTYSREIIQSMIQNLLKKNNNIIYGRNTSIKEVSGKDASKFLDENHRQGNANSAIRLGLYHENKLVSLMTFGNMRHTIGTSKNESTSDCYELVRFCSRLNTTVVGGASKLFNYFIKKYQPERIRSFSDRAHTQGNLYRMLGFKHIRNSDPGYVWVDAKTDVSYNRVNSQKHNIVKFLHDNSVDLSKTEKQIMEEHNYLQVYDCGTCLWEWHNL